MTNRLPHAPSSKKKVLERIARHGTVSKAELMKELAMTSTSLTRVLEEMTDEGLLKESGLGHSTGGRKPILYEVNASYRYLFGLEISRMYSSLGLFDMKLNRLAAARWRMDEKMTPARLVDLVREAAAGFMNRCGVQAADVAGIGIGAVGPLSREQGMILHPMYYPAEGWSQLPICRMLEEKLGFPARLENGANTALIGEHWALRGENVSHMLYVHVGTGLRSSMISGGQLVYGAVDMEGAIGQMIIQTDGPRLQENGNYGALEAFVSVQALEKTARSLSKLGREGLLERYRLAPEKIDFAMLVKALHEGDASVREMFVQSATYFGIGLANLINILHPEIIVLGGALVGAHELFFETATRVALNNLYYYPEYTPEFSKGRLKEDAVSTGAAVMIFNELQV